MRQEAPTKPCACGRGKIYTAEQDKVRNAKVDGKTVCIECKVDAIYRKVHDGRV